MEKTQTMCNSIDKNGNCTHFKIADIEIWIEYDNAGRQVYYKEIKNNRTFEEWRAYNKEGKLISLKDSKGYDEYRKYDKNGRCIFLSRSRI